MTENSSIFCTSFSDYYLRQQSRSLFVCLLPEYLKKLVTDLNQIFWNDRSLATNSRLHLETVRYPGLDTIWISE